ncbi:high mobility group box domain-containing protein [Fusarium flagelliforme]|uniref:Mating type protein 1-1-3 n=1 Tax=Fusarium flagelliforme TaxID=2675880 RepID=A0A395MA50_9HYPO|nr:high mobility group box domain-containing protein [Fusarium flagelliforme]KAH7185334.1 high mobility group box domain-containing protein [Fusarium flagelliforme]RFN44706.1 mating type protein 1-1-3 [Fusarium flagelliforme]
MSENLENGLVQGPLGVRTPPEAEVPITFVYSQSQNDIHAFLPEDASMRFVNHVADNLSRRVQQPVKVFHDEARRKYRLCPIPRDIFANTSTYGRYCFSRDQSTPAKVSTKDSTVGEEGQRIPRPRNRWMLYRQAKSLQIIAQNEGLTAGELSRIISTMWDNETPETQAYWHRLADQEDANHKRLYPGYKYSTTGEHAN